MRYHVKSERVSLAKRLTRSTIIFALTLLGSLLIHRLWFAQSTWALSEKLFDALVAGYAMFIFDSRRREYEIEVTDDAISMRGGPLALSAHKVRRGRVHFVRELHGNIFREPALGLSEHGLIHRFLFGYVWVPQNMPQYEEIKTKAMTWVDNG
jgi:membrane protein YdbS with pleckstrin-like domain